MRVRYTEAARNDLRSIYLQGEDMFGARQANAYAAGLHRAILLAADYPLASRLRVDLAQSVRAKRYKAHVIVYTVDEAGMLVLRLRHGHEDWLHETDGPDPDRSDDP